MKFSIYLITLYLAGLGLSAHSPDRHEGSLELHEPPSQSLDSERSNPSLEKRKKPLEAGPQGSVLHARVAKGSSRKPSSNKDSKQSAPASSPDNTSSPASPSSSSRPKSTISSSSSPSSSPTASSSSASSSDISKSSSSTSSGSSSTASRPFSTNTGASTLSTFSTVTSSATRSGSKTSSATVCTRSAKATRGAKVPRSDQGSSSQAEVEASTSCEEEQYIDYGFGWRSPTKEERRRASPVTLDKPDPQVFKAMTDFPKEGKGKGDCPKSAQDIVDKGVMVSPENGFLFYTAVDAQEKTWAGNHRRGFQLMLDIIEDEWMKQNLRCPRLRPYLSTAAALLAKGDVHVLLPRKTFEVGEIPVWPDRTSPGNEGKNTIWKDHEWPTLIRRNTGACRIWRWVGSNEPDLLAVKTSPSCSLKYEKEPENAVKKTHTVVYPSGGEGLK